MNIASVSNVPIYVAGIALAVLLFVTLMVLPRNMAAAQTPHRKRHIAFLISSSVLMSFFLVIIMIDIAALI
jgi:hypothetical protein|nr:MAG TPA: hypothetical protein [Caudoviricetes sp.]